MKEKLNVIYACTITCLVLLSIVSCTKDFLDIKRNKAQVVPASLTDYRSLLDNPVMISAYPNMGELGSDDYTITKAVWNALSNPIYKNGYVWADDVYQGAPCEDWNRGYERIMLANFILEGLQNVKSGQDKGLDKNAMIGEAYFYRALSLYMLTPIFCKTYDPIGAKDNLGLPLRTSSNINTIFQRDNLQNTFLRIEEDLRQAISRLPRQVDYITRPGKAAAHAVLANVYLYMDDYVAAYKQADTALMLQSELLDYNVLDVAAAVPFKSHGKDNPEVIMFLQATNPTPMNTARMNVASDLLALYDENDLRKKVFYTSNSGRIVFKGAYSGIPSSMFVGMTTAEMLLVRAECAIRVGELEIGRRDLNRLMEHRMDKNFLEALPSGLSQDDLLRLVVNERRKELVFRGRRWADLKRLNKEEEFEKQIQRVLDDEKYELPIGSNKWEWPIPIEVVNLSGIIQNER